MSIKTIKIISIAALVVLASTSAAFAQFARQTGTVVDEEGNPLQGITVTMHKLNESAPGDDQYTDVTNEEGRFVFAGTRHGRWRLEINEPGYVPHAQILQLSSLERNDPVTITLKKERPAETGGEERLTRDMVEEIEALLSDEKWDEAIAEVEKLMESLPASSGVLALYLGTAYEGKGEAAKAKEYFITGLEANPDSAFALKKLGDMAVAEKNYEEGLNYYDKLLLVEKETPNLYFTAGELALSTGNNEKAISYFETYIESGEDPAKLANAHMQLGFTLSYLNRNEEAVRHLEKVLEIQPEFPFAGEIQSEITRLKALLENEQ